MTAVGCEDGKKHLKKSIQASNILYLSHRTGTTGEIQRVVCWWAIPTRVRWKSQADDEHLSVCSNAHLLYGLAVPAFQCPYDTINPFPYIGSFCFALIKRTNPFYCLFPSFCTVPLFTAVQCLTNYSTSATSFTADC